MTKSPLLPSNSTIRPGNGPKKATNGPDCMQFVSNCPKNGPYLGLRGSNQNSEGTKATRKPPLFVVSKPQNRPTRRLDIRTSGRLVEPEGSHAAEWGPTVGPPGSLGPEKKRSTLPRMLKQVFLANFEPVVMHFGPWKIPKCFENGPKKGQKHVFSKVIVDQLGCTNK